MQKRSKPPNTPKNRTESRQVFRRSDLLICNWKSLSKAGKEPRTRRNQTPKSNFILIDKTQNVKE